MNSQTIHESAPKKSVANTRSSNAVHAQHARPAATDSRLFVPTKPVFLIADREPIRASEDAGFVVTRIQLGDAERPEAHGPLGRSSGPQGLRAGDVRVGAPVVRRAGER
jgi:hypothetical protein